VSKLVTEDDAPVDNVLCEKNQRLLTEALYASWEGPPADEDRAQRTFLACANVGLFPSVKEDPLVPDAFLSLDVELPPHFHEKGLRSYFFWEFGKPPEVVVEIVSNREGGELGRKKRRYAVMRIAHYVVWDPGGELGPERMHVFELHGDVYVAARAPRFPRIGLELVEWDGVYERSHATWLRWRRLDGALVETGAEHAAAAESRASAAERRASAAESRAGAAESRAARLAEKLRKLGVEPNGNGDGGG
jgi:hypothetical protein